MTAPALRIVNGQTMQAPYPADVSANGWRFELDMWRIKQSMTWLRCPPDMRPWLLLLWAEAWTQIPCGSLPADDNDIALIIGMAPSLFIAHRHVLLSGWAQCSDGRLYHATITELVEQMRDGRRKEREKKARQRHGAVTGESQGCPQGLPGESTGSPATGTGTGTGTGSKPIAPNAIAFDAEAGWLGISDKRMAGWRLAYPAIDVPQQLAAAHAWAVDNPKNRKDNWGRFLTNWLARAQEKAPARGGATSHRRID